MLENELEALILKLNLSEEGQSELRQHIEKVDKERAKLSCAVMVFLVGLYTDNASMASTEEQVGKLYDAIGVARPPKLVGPK